MCSVGRAAGAASQARHQPILEGRSRQCDECMFHCHEVLLAGGAGGATHRAICRGQVPRNPGERGGAGEPAGTARPAAAQDGDRGARSSGLFRHVMLLCCCGILDFELSVATSSGARWRPKRAPCSRLCFCFGICSVLLRCCWVFDCEVPDATGPRFTCACDVDERHRTVTDAW